MNKATRALFSALSLLAGIMGIEHGIGEVVAGYRPTDGILILSWPNSAFFRIMAGEPAMTIIPNYLVTGLLAIGFSVAFLLASARFRGGARGFLPLLALLILMLLTGAGFGPPVLGAIAVLIALKVYSPLKAWRRLPSSLHRALGVAWPWAFGFCLLGWLMIFPGAPLIAFFTGLDHPLLMGAPILLAFALIPITLVLGFSRDVLRTSAGSLPAAQ